MTFPYLFYVNIQFIFLKSENICLSCARNEKDKNHVFQLEWADEPIERAINELSYSLIQEK